MIQKLQRQLRESEKQYQHLVDMVHDAIVISQEGDIVYANSVAVALVGFADPEAFIGQTVADFMPENYGELSSTSLQSWTTHRLPVTLTGQRLVRRDGECIPVDIVRSMILYDGIPAFQLVIRATSPHRGADEPELSPVQRTENVWDGIVATIGANAQAAPADQEGNALRVLTGRQAEEKNRCQLGQLLGKSAAMQEVYNVIIKAAACEANVVICGETGVGKELVAQTIHQLSARAAKPFVVVNCGAVTENLFEREFFGHRRGAFTGADRSVGGYLDAAHQGTLFLDEVGELNQAMQVKLLRAVESGEYTPIGSHVSQKADVRIIAATNRNLETMCRQGQLREDFYYRIQVLKITVPPLRERREDIPLLVQYFLQHYSKEEQCFRLIPADVMSILYHKYEWPGNVRELQNKIQHYLALGQYETNSQPLVKVDGLLAASPISHESTGLFDFMEQVEKRLICHALQKNAGKRQETADMLRISRRTLYKKMKQYGIESVQ